MKAEATTTGDVDNENKENEEDKILNEMEELTYAMERKQKRKKKLIAKRRAKVRCLVISLSSSFSFTHECTQHTYVLWEYPCYHLVIVYVQMMGFLLTNKL